MSVVYGSKREAGVVEEAERKEGNARQRRKGAYKVSTGAAR